VKKLVVVGMVTALVGFQMLPGKASSHREAPLISQDPTADNTDLYAFVSPDQPNTVTIVANYIPLEQPAGGPNFPAFDDNVLYEIHVDNSGDAKEDLTYQFRFTTETRDPETFLYNVGPITSLTDPDWNRPQTYSVTLVRGDRNGHGELLGSHISTPPDNIGPRSTPNYESLATAAITTLSNGIKVFAGQRDDPFFVDLGSIFDLAGLRPFNGAHIIPLPTDTGHDGVANFNTHTIAMQIPKSQLVGSGNGTIGIYASASRPQVRILNKDGNPDDNGPFIQVSRLGQPLINEVVIPLGQKDQWNRSDPGDDQQFLNRYLSPEVTRLENFLYPVLDNANETNRNDLVAVLLTGVPTLNFTGPKPADLLRLNTTLAPTAPVGKGDRLGVLNGDFAGYPNGRRLEDDIVDIDLRAFAEGYGPILNAALGLLNRTPNNTLGDGVDSNADASFLPSFPYLGTPHQGYEVP
jgi:hypothetical protein